MARDRGRSGSSADDRGPGVDLFHDPPWTPDRDDAVTGRTWFGHLGFVLFVSFLAFLGAALVLAGLGLVAAVNHFSFGLGSLDLNLFPPSPSANGMDIALSPDGTRAYVTEPSDDRLVVLDVRTGRVLATVPVGDTPSGLALSPNGTQVWVVNTGLDSSSTSATGPNTGGSSISVVATATDSVMGTIALSDFGSIDVAFSPDGHWAYVTNNGLLTSGSVNWIDTSTLAVGGTFLLTIAPPPSSTGWNPTSVAVADGGRQLWVSAVNDLAGATATPDDLYVFDTSTHLELDEIPVGSGPFFMILSRDGRDAYVADKQSCDLRQIDTATFQVVATVHWPPTDGCPFGLADGPNDDVVDTVTGNDHSIDQGQAGNAFGAVDFGTGQILVDRHVGTDPVTVALSPSGWAAYVVDADRPRVDVVDPATGATVSTIALPAS